MDTREKASHLISRFKWLERLERLTSPMHNPGDSIAAVILRKVRVFAEFSVISIVENRSIRNAKRHNRRYPLVWRKKYALVMGNGPSISKLNLTEFSNKTIKNDLDIFVVNNFLHSALFQSHVNPAFYVISDPLDKPAVDVNRIWPKLKSLSSESRIVLPMAWFDSATTLYPDLTKSFYFFDDRSLEGFSSNVSPNRPRGYLQLTAYKALAIACSGDYKKIGIIGIDNTMFKGLRVNNRNELFLEANHTQGTGHSEMSVSKLYPDGSAGYFYFVSKSFQSLAVAFRNYPILNLDPESLVDAFEKTSPLLAELMKDKH